MKSLLLVIDASPASRPAVHLCADWADRFGAEVEVLGIVNEHAVAAPEPVSIGGSVYKQHRDESLLASAHRLADDALAEVSRTLRARGIRFRIDKGTTLPAAEILSAAAACDLVIMPRQTRFALPEQDEPDGTLEEVLPRSPRPVVAVPETVHSGEGALAACSGGVRSARALQEFVSNDLHQFGPIWVLSVDRDVAAAAEEQVQRASTFLRIHGADCRRLPVVSDERVEDVILREADRLGVGLIVMGAHGRWRILGNLTHSVTSEVLAQATVPVMLGS